MSYRGPDWNLIVTALKMYSASMQAENGKILFSMVVVEGNKRFASEEEGNRYSNNLWEIKRVEEALSKIGEVTSTEHFVKNGGTWLGNVRDFIQRKFRNGESVTWGSQEFLQGGALTVADLEYLAARIAVGAVNDYRGRS